VGSNSPNSWPLFSFVMAIRWDEIRMTELEMTAVGMGERERSETVTRNIRHEEE
jgi:hypothetical protein